MYQHSLAKHGISNIKLADAEHKVSDTWNASAFTKPSVGVSCQALTQQLMNSIKGKHTCCTSKTLGAKKMVTRLCPFSFRLPALSLMSSTDTKVLPEPESQDKPVGVGTAVICHAQMPSCVICMLS